MNRLILLLVVLLGIVVFALPKADCFKSKNGNVELCLKEKGDCLLTIDDNHFKGSWVINDDVFIVSFLNFPTIKLRKTNKTTLKRVDLVSDFAFPKKLQLR